MQVAGSLVQKLGIVNKSLVSPITQLIVRSKPIRISIARLRPTFRAAACWCLGSFPAKMARNTTLSMPSTISSPVSVSRATRLSTVNS